MTKKYRPSSGDEGSSFIAHQCHDCIRDKENRETGEGGCEIITLSMAYDVDDAEYPSEWIVDDKGPRCTAYCHEDDEPPVQRCSKTMDIFGEPEKAEGYLL